MADKTTIEWAANADGSPGASWNPIRARHRETGKVGWFCVHASTGCVNCYAERLNTGRFGNGVAFKAQNIDQVEIFLDENTLSQPLKWRKPRTIFVCSMTDLFADFVPVRFIHHVFAAMALCPQHTFIVLTKRSARMRELLDARGPFGAIVQQTAIGFALARLTDRSRTGWPLPNVWLGVSAEDQQNADQRIPDLLATPAVVRFASIEPLLAPIDLDAAWHGEPAIGAECWGDCGWCAKGFTPLHNCQRGRQSEADADKGRSGLDWVIVGGESGPKARPMHPQWARDLRDQCASAGVPFFFKQWGAWAPRGCTPGLWLTAEGDVFGPCASDDRRVGEGCVGMSRVGKENAGALLDGVAHTARPPLACEQPKRSA